MTLTSNTVDITEDPITYSDLQTHTLTSGSATCRYCGNSVSDHGATEELPEHEHITRDDTQICRRLYECSRMSSVFYIYQDLNTVTRWAMAPVTEVSVEQVDDSEVLQFGRKKLSESIKPTWRFKTKMATKTDFTDILAKNLITGLEIELDFNENRTAISDSNMSRVFGIHPSEYHHHPECPVCGSSSCWNHQPTNLIRGIERDASINGWEFLVYGGRISSEDFAKRLPLAKMREYFQANERDGLHVHAMLVHDIPQLPNVIAKNLWQLFRYYYPAWVYLFGNYKATQGFLRKSQYNGHDYVKFTTFSKSPFNTRWARDVKNREHARCGLYLINTPIEDEMMNSFDIEIRTSDATLDLEQLIAVRAITKAMILRAAQLSNFGLISVESNEEVWSQVKNVVTKINERDGITLADTSFMRKHTINLLRELAPFLSELERNCMKHLIEKPVRERENRLTTLDDIVPDISETAKNLKKLISTTSIEVESEEAWFARMAKLMGLSVAEVKTAIRQLKAYFDIDTKTMVIVG